MTHAEPSDMARVIWTLDSKRTPVRARRLVVEGAARLRSQCERVKCLRVAGLDTADAEALLGLLEDAQLAMIANLARRELEFGA